MVVAGADSSGRAGIAADREAIEAQGLGMQSVVSVWTRQDASGVSSFSPLEPETWEAEAARLLDRDPAALKFGLLPGPLHLQAAARLSARALERGIPVVLDPVLGSSSGFAFLDAVGVTCLRAQLLVQRLVLTPNLPEAAQLAGWSPAPGRVARPVERLEMAQRMLDLGVRAVLLKGGHGAEDPVQDLVLERGTAAHWHSHRRLAGRSLGGSGCRYASCVAAGLAQGLGMREAAALAGDYVLQRLQQS